VARPIPDAPPVIKILRPVSRVIVQSLPNDLTRTQGRQLLCEPCPPSRWTEAHHPPNRRVQRRFDRHDGAR
jgi:hypothetical protein